MAEKLNKKEAIELLKISEKCFENYFRFSKEINGFQEKKGARWHFDKDELEKWKQLKENRTIKLTLEEYEKCFEFAIKMVYGGLALHGIRGKRSEVQAADDVILGILAEHAVKRFLMEKFNTEIKLDEEVHTAYITPQDFDKVKDNGVFRDPKVGVGIKASKLKNAYLVLGQNEAELEKRKSGVYIFARVDLPSDHLFRILRDHSFFKTVTEFLEKSEGFRKIKELKEIPVWICGFTKHNELEKTDEIPGQEFESYRYVKSVANLHNSDEEWKEFISML